MTRWDNMCRFRAPREEDSRAERRQSIEPHPYASSEQEPRGMDVLLEDLLTVVGGSRSPVFHCQGRRELPYTPTLRA